MHDPSVTTFLFTDIEGSTRLWEQEPERMHEALARHDALARACVSGHRGTVVKTTGDGIHAVFADPLDAVHAVIALQLALADPAATGGIALRIRCGMHAGVEARRDDDFFGNAVNRAARVMSVAHGGQVLVSQAVATLVLDRLPATVSLLDLGSVRLRDLTHPERVYQVLHPGLRPQFPALRSLEATPNNLPQQLTSFIGREHELAEAKRQLRNARLLTLVGIGGLGKSRLSLQIAAETLDDYPDGVWFVELAPVTDARLVPQVVASILGVKEDTGQPVVDVLRTFVKDRELLLVLDNCEHLAQACADLARQLLEAGPRVKVLASSRERLNIRGEKIFPLAPLAVPAPEQKLSREDVGHFAAIRLFADRAAAANPDFEVTDANMGAVVEICQRLDGIPLALELAAARTRAMSAERIAARLTDRFRLLGGGGRAALPRQQTLRALIDWSYDLLADDEKMLFRGLSAFAGGFTLEAAEAVGSGELAAADVLDPLTRLVEKSLVVLDTANDRYRMLEIVRQYAQERLAEDGDESETRSRHVAWYLEFAGKARSSLFGSDQGAWLRRMDLERENILAAHASCDTVAGGPESGLRLAARTKAYWINRGLLHLGHRVTAEALARPGAQARDLARCRALFDLGQIDMVMGNHANAQRCLEESLAVAREIGDRGRIAAVLQPLGLVHTAQHNLGTAREYLDEAVALAREIGIPREIAAALSVLAQLDRVEGALDAAETRCHEMLELVRVLDDRASIAIGLLNLAMVAIDRGRPDRARAWLSEAASLSLELGSMPIEQCVLDVAAGLAAHGEQWDRAARLFGAAEAIIAQTQLQRERADAAFLEPLIARARVALGPAAYAAAEGAGRALASSAAMAEAQCWLAGAP
ncbi:MAG: adenylate/guanylate cyclase domain-containing protein [Betaproteobacteria bacterium]